MILKRCFTTVGSLFVIALSFGCSDSQPTQSPREVALAQLDTAGSDLLTFARRQRDFTKALTAGSVEDLAALVRLDFMIYSATRPQFVQPGTAHFPDGFVTHSSITADYVRLLRDRLQLPYSDQSMYRLYRQRARATVITYPTSGEPYLTGWDSTPAGWRVRSVTINLTSQQLATTETVLKEASIRASR